MNYDNVLERVNCIFCGSNQSGVLYTRVDARYYLDENVYSMNQCGNCGGFYLSPRVKEENISQYYPSDFYFDHATPGGVWRKEFSKNKKKYYMYMAELKPGRLLDVGCRDGSFVKFMELFGWQAKGFEYSENVKNRFGCNILYKDLYQFDENSFDVITLWAVLEHLYHPNEYIEYFYKILKPNGNLIIQVPKYNSFTGKMLLHEDIPRHVSAFSSEWLIGYIQKFGYDLININTQCTVFNGSSHGFLRYLLLRLMRQSQPEALRAIYDVRLRREDMINDIDRFSSKYLDILLRKLDYWGQMTAVFKKKNRVAG